DFFRRAGLRAGDAGGEGGEVSEGGRMQKGVTGFVGHDLDGEHGLPSFRSRRQGRPVGAAEAGREPAPADWQGATRSVTLRRNPRTLHPGSPMSEVTRILSAIEQGDLHAAEQLLPLVYDELRQLAAQRLAQETPGQTLQATALVHEAYLRLV